MPRVARDFSSKSRLTSAIWSPITRRSKSFAPRSRSVRRRSALVTSATSTIRTCASAYAKSIQPILQRADNDDAALDVQRAKYEQQAIEQANGLRDKMSQEVALVEGYAQNLDGLDQQARLLVGEIAMKNFSLVRDRLKSIVLRADV